MVLKPQDVFVTLKLVALGAQRWTYLRLASELFMSASEINAAVKRAIRARLLTPPVDRRDNPRPVVMALEEFLVHGIKYAFPPDRGELTVGIPTSGAALPLVSHEPSHEELPPVWPVREGAVRGYAFSPLYPSAPLAAGVDPRFHELLALVDAIRDQRCRSRNRAARELTARLAGADTTGCSLPAGG